MSFLFSEKRRSVIYTTRTKQTEQILEKKTVLWREHQQQKNLKQRKKWRKKFS